MDKDQTNTTITVQHQAYITANYALNTISILFSILLLTIIIALRIKQINFSNRLSIRLIMYISITEIFFSISQMIMPDYEKHSTSLIFLSSWGYVFSSLLICFLIMSIIINLQLVLTLSHNEINYFKKYYFLTSFSLSIILSLLPISANQFVYDKNQKFFWYNSLVWEWTTYYGWISFTIFYCILSTIFMFYRLNKRSLQSLSDNSNARMSNDLLSSTSEKSKTIAKYISRIIFYSLVPVLSYSPMILVHFFVNYNYLLNLFSLIFLSSQSTFIFIIFLFDPIIDEMLMERKRNAEHKKDVLDKIKRGVYVDNVYKIGLELPSNEEQKQNNKKISYYRNTIYSYAKNRISGIFYNNNNKKSVESRKDVFNLDDEEENVLYLL